MITHSRFWFYKICAFILLLTVCFANGFNPVAWAADIQKIRIARPSASMNFMHLSLVTEFGLDRDEGLAIELIQMRSSITVAALISGDLDYNFSFESTIDAALQGAPVLGVGLTQDKPPFLIIARPEIRGFADLKGKIVGQADVTSSAAHAFRRVLLANGLKEQDYTMIPAGRNAARLNALLNGHIKATSFSPPFHVKALKAGMKSLGKAGDYTQSTNGVGTTVRKVKENRGQVKRLLRLLLRTNQWMESHPDETIAFMMREYKIDKETARDSYEFFMSTLSNNGQIGDEYIQELVHQWRQRTPNAPSNVSLDRLRDFSIAKEVAKELGLN